MSPRPAATTDDESAGYFLDAAAQLIDAMFVVSEEDRPRRLRSIDFPAALQWLRLEDVISLAQDGRPQGASHKAFHNRWQSKEAFVKDAVIHTMLFRDAPNADTAAQVAEMARVAEAASLGDAIANFSDAMLVSLMSYPRSYLLTHIGPLLDQHPDLKAAIVEDMGVALAPWYEGYAGLFAAYGAALRPGWTIDRYGLTVQSMIDGFLLRSRVENERMTAARFNGVSLFAEAVVAFTLGVIDTSDHGQTARKAVDVAVRLDG